VQVLESGQVSIIGCDRARAHTPISTSCSLAPTSAALHSPGKQRSCIRSSQVHQEVQRLSRRVETGLRRCPYGYDTSTPRPRNHVGNAPQSNLRGYAAAGLEASLHNLLTSARLTAGLDALHVGEDHGRDIQVRIEGGTVRIERLYAVPELHGDGAGRRVRRRGFSRTRFYFFPTHLPSEKVQEMTDLTRTLFCRPRLNRPASGPNEGSLNQQEEGLLIAHQRYLASPVQTVAGH
jgi:hypothetical protein